MDGDVSRRRGPDRYPYTAAFSTALSSRPSSYPQHIQKTTRLSSPVALCENSQK